MIGNGVWDTKYPKQYRKGTFDKPPVRSSEKAWVKKRSRWEEGRIKFKNRQIFLDYVRYMRWYTFDSRSYIMCRIDPKPPFYEPPHYAQWPRHIP